jgi:hypothetical protein
MLVLVETKVRQQLKCLKSPVEKQRFLKEGGSRCKADFSNFANFANKPLYSTADCHNMLKNNTLFRRTAPLTEK